MNDDRDKSSADALTNGFEILCDVIAHLLPDHNPALRVRLLNLGDEYRPGGEELEAATLALECADADNIVDAKIALALLHSIETHYSGDIDVDALRARLISHVERRWSSLVSNLIECTLAANVHRQPKIFLAFPQLRDDPALINRFIVYIAHERYQAFQVISTLNEIAPASMEQGRLLITAILEGRTNFSREFSDVATALFCALGRGMGWTPWISFLAILQARPDYADQFAEFEKVGDSSKESLERINRRLEMAREIEGQVELRKVAGFVIDLVGRDGGWSGDGLLARPAETRGAYVRSLSEVIGDNRALRQAVIEVLLWFANGRAADLAHFAAVALTQPEDRSFLLELNSHPVRLVRYAAGAVRAAKFGEELEIEAPNVAASLTQSLARLEGGTKVVDEPAQTWLGDRAIERLVEQTIAKVETKFAQEYERHGEEGEDRLLASLFTELATRFSALDQALEGWARAASAPLRAAVNMKYRNIDRAEEGKEGIKGVKSFSADLCLIVDPIIDGTSLGRRVTLVQAKRLYRDKKARKQPSWDRSFKINRDQRIHLQEQTHSSVYFFHGPLNYGRGVPVIPTQLVADLSEHQGMGTALDRDVVGIASRSLADWLTYDALALRIGDRYEELVEKAEGEPGSLPRSLLDLPTVEVQIAIKPRSEDR